MKQNFKGNMGTISRILVLLYAFPTVTIKRKQIVLFHLPIGKKY